MKGKRIKLSVAELHKTAKKNELIISKTLKIKASTKS